MRLALALTSAQADRLRKEADRLGIAPAVLARATLEDLCDLPDAGFRAAAERIVPKNQELSLASPDAVSDACRDPRAAPRDAGAVRWHAGHSRSGCPARCAGPAAPPWRPFSRCMVSASRRPPARSGPTPVVLDDGHPVDLARQTELFRVLRAIEVDVKRLVRYLWQRPDRALLIKERRAHVYEMQAKAGRPLSRVLITGFERYANRLKAQGAPSRKGWTTPLSNCSTRWKPP